ncbi:hypothetical protein BS17DRAFT_771484 [Gyrodon lividus]|nr:hypothetical protein BS17DRAFT_771484 [Gyrodon lividus]
MPALVCCIIVAWPISSQTWPTYFTDDQLEYNCLFTSRGDSQAWDTLDSPGMFFAWVFIFDTLHLSSSLSRLYRSLAELAVKGHSLRGQCVANSNVFPPYTSHRASNIVWD